MKRLSVTAFLFVLTSAVAQASPSPASTVCIDVQAEELPQLEHTPGAVRVSSVSPIPSSCPAALAINQAPPRGCPGPATFSEICGAHGTRQFRHQAGVTKRSVCASYGIPHDLCSSFEDDHLVPLELGGADDRRNHWPQPWSAEWGALQKDWLENELRRLVCDRHLLGLAEAQRCIADEWTLCYAQAKRGDYSVMGR